MFRSSGITDTDDFTAHNINVVTPGRLRRGVRYAAPEEQRTDVRIAQLRIIVRTTACYVASGLHAPSVLHSPHLIQFPLQE